MWQKLKVYTTREQGVSPCCKTVRSLLAPERSPSMQEALQKGGGPLGVAE